MPDVMIRYIQWIFLLLLVGSCVDRKPINIVETPAQGFKSNRPADVWQESLVSGNGEMGALIMGHPYSDTVILNHAQLYMPINKPLKPVSQGEHLEEIRSMMLNGNYGKASQYVVERSHQEGWEGKRWTDPFIPAFDMVITMKEDSVAEYARKVNFQTGEVSVQWEDSRGKFSRTSFVSRKDSMMITRLRSNDAPLNCRISLKKRLKESWWGNIDVRENNGIENVNINASDNFITYRCSFINKWEGLISGYEGVTYLVNKGGTLQAENHRLNVTDADELLIFTRIKPSHDLNDSKIPGILDDLKNTGTDYATLLNRHQAIHGEIFNRTRLDIGGSEERKNKPVEQLLDNDHPQADPALVELEFDAARYNIISATGINPPNLQGIWGGTTTPPWSSDFTMNGNVPVAVSSMLPANMPELMLPLFDMLERHMDDFEQNAKRLFDCRGIHVPSRMSSHGLNNHFDATWPMTFWTGGAGWYARFYYDYYLYTGDKEFLRNRALPFMEQAVLFYEDFLTTGSDGKYVFNPSYSPENHPGNIPHQACINATMDVMIAKELIRHIMEASKIAGVNQDKIPKWKDMLSKMPDYQLNEKGYLREWMWPGVEENPGHRHVSHLYALFGRMDPEIKNNSRLLKGAKMVIDRKMKIRRREQGGVMAFGMAQLAYAAANLGDSQACYDMLQWLSSRYWNNNMVTTHDPGAIFNLDLSGGYPNVLIKMLVYSEPGLVKLFPALPHQMSKGTIEGVLLRGNMEIIRLHWDEKEVNLSVLAKSDSNIVLELPGETESIRCEGAEMATHKNSNAKRLNLTKGNTAQLNIELKEPCYK